MRKWSKWLAALAVAFTTVPAWPQFGPTPVVVSPVIQREVAAGQTFVGTVRPTRTSTVGSAVDGRVEEFPVNEGDRVKQGQVLAQLRTGTLELERDAARAEADMRRHELEELQNGSRPEEIAQAKARVAAAEARRQYARQHRDRVKLLHAQGRSATEQELQEAVSGADHSEQMLVEAQAGLKLAEVGPRKEKIAQAKARLRAQEETVKKIEDQIELHTIRAPFDGYVSAEHAEVGQWLLKGAAVVELVELDKVDIEVAVTEDAVSSLHVGDSALVEVGALPDRRFTGTIALIVPQANPRSRTFPVKVRVENVRHNNLPLLKSNMFARVTLALGKPAPGLLVPKDALVLGGPTPQVFVVDADPADESKLAVRPVPVQTGVASGNWIQVKADLKSGQRVVVQGNERLRPGQPVVVTRMIEPEKAAGAAQK